MTKPAPVTPNPWVYEARDYQNKVLRIEIRWSDADRDLLSAVAYRDPGCVYDTIFIGLDAEGSVNRSPDQWTVPEGETLIRNNLLKKARLRSIDDVQAVQVTAGTSGAL